MRYTGAVCAVGGAPIEKKRANDMKDNSIPGGGQITLRGLLRGWRTEPSLILLLTPILLMVWVYYGKQAAFEAQWLQGHPYQDAASALYEFLTAFLLMAVIPAILVKVVFKKRLRDFGLTWGDAKFGFTFVAVAAPLLLLSVYAGAATPAIQAEYPLARSAVQSLPLFLAIETAYVALYYTSWEFFYRGFMLFGLENHYGALAAILIQTIPSTIVHIGKPASETFAAIAAGLVFGYLAVRTRSFLYPLILHAIVGVGTDVFVLMRLV
jgi:membrane protease YdiL (CAAX protease family)